MRETEFLSDVRVPDIGKGTVRPCSGIHYWPKSESGTE